MQWALLCVIVVILLFMSSHYPRAAFTLFGGLVFITSILLYVTTEDGILNRQKLPNNNIKIENAVMNPSYGGGYRFSARLINVNESVLLKESVVSITMLDCVGQEEDSCRVIGQNNARINILIPAGQARDVSLAMYFDAAKPSGEVRWKYQITETRS